MQLQMYRAQVQQHQEMKDRLMAQIGDVGSSGTDLFKQLNLIFEE